MLDSLLYPLEVMKLQVTTFAPECLANSCHLTLKFWALKYESSPRLERREHQSIYDSAHLSSPVTDFGIQENILIKIKTFEVCVVGDSINWSLTSPRNCTAYFVLSKLAQVSQSRIFYGVLSIPTFAIKTTSSAQQLRNISNIYRWQPSTYAAEAPSNSCRFAFVNRASAAEKSRVATSNNPIQIAFDVLAFVLLKDEPMWDSPQTGTIKSASTAIMIMPLVRRSTRALVGRNRSSSVVFSAVSLIQVSVMIFTVESQSILPSSRKHT